MKFSVIIAAYNAEKTIGKCLQSLKEQTFSDFEAIVVDDGSVDGTGEIARDYAREDNRFRYIHHENCGVSATRNRGLNAAAGEYVVFLDSDDRYDLQYLQIFDELIEAYPECEHFWCGYQSVDPNGNNKGTCAWPGETGEVHLVNRSGIMDLHEKSLDAALWNKAYRRQILEKHQLCMDDNLSLGEDLLFNFAYLDICSPEIVISSRPLYIYTKAENGSLDSKYRDDLKENFDLLNEKLLQYLQSWDVAPEQMMKYYCSVFYTYERVLRNTYRPESKLTAEEKRAFNREIVRSEKFQTALKRSACGIHPLYRLAYELKSWDLVMLLDGLAKLKRKLMR